MSRRDSAVDAVDIRKALRTRTSGVARLAPTTIAVLPERVVMASSTSLCLQGASCSARPKKGNSSGARNAVTSSMLAALKVSTMMPSGSKVLASSSQR